MNSHVCWRVYQSWGLLYHPICTSPSVQSWHDQTVWDGAWKGIERDIGGLVTLVSQWKICLLLLVHLFVVLAFSSHEEITGFCYRIKRRQDSSDQNLWILTRVEEGEWSGTAHRLSDGTMKHLFTRIPAAYALLFPPFPSPFHLFSKHKPPTTAFHPFLDILALSEHIDGFYS